MKKLLRNRTVLACLCIALAALLAFVAAPLAQKSAQKETEVYVTKAPVRKGTELTESYLKVISVPAQYLPAGTITEKEKIVGQYAKTDLVAGDYVLTDKLSKIPTVANDWYKDVAPERLAISVSIKSFASGLSAKLEPGDIVSFVCIRSDGSTIPEELKYMQVAAVTTELAQDFDAQKQDAAESLPATVTVFATPAQAELLADYELNSNLHVALVSRGDEQRAEELLETQQVALSEGAAEVSPEEVTVSE